MSVKKISLWDIFNSWNVVGRFLFYGDRHCCDLLPMQKQSKHQIVDRDQRKYKGKTFPFKLYTPWILLISLYHSGVKRELYHGAIKKDEQKTKH